MKKLPLTLLEMRASSDMWKLVHRVVLKSENYHMTLMNTLEDMCISEYQNRLMTYEMKENCRPLLLCVRHHCYAYPAILSAPDIHSATKKVTKKWQHTQHMSKLNLNIKVDTAIPLLIVMLILQSSPRQTAIVPKKVWAHCYLQT